MSASKNKKIDPHTLARLRERDPVLIQELVDAHTDVLFRAALGVAGSKPDAEDLVQTTWITFYDACERFEGKSEIRTFLFGILYNKGRDLYRDRMKSENHDPIEDHLDSRFDSTGHWIQLPISPEKFAAGTQTKEILEGCFEKLPAIQKAAFQLREIEESDTSEICEILSVTANNLSVLLFRAKNRLRECIEGKLHAHV